MAPAFGAAESRAEGVFSVPSKLQTPRQINPRCHWSGSFGRDKAPSRKRQMRARLQRNPPLDSTRIVSTVTVAPARTRVVPDSITRHSTVVVLE